MKILTGIISLALLAIVGLIVATPANATGQEVCPEGEGWTKVDNIDAQSYEYTAPEGYEVSESCYKAGTTLRFAEYDPTQETVTVTSNVWNKPFCPFNIGCNFKDISHASFLLVKLEEPVEVCEDESALNYGQEGECEYEPEPEPEPEPEATPSAKVKDGPQDPQPLLEVETLPDTGTEIYLIALGVLVVALGGAIALYQYKKN